MATDRDIDTLERSADAAGAPPAPVGGFEASYASQLDEAEVIRQYVPMVKRLALRLKGRIPEAVQLDDLIQAGLIAVLRLARQGGLGPVGDAALQRSIINAMIDEARREIWAPVRTVRLAKSAAQAMRAVNLREGRDGNDEEIAAEMGIGLGDYHSALVEIAGIRMVQIDEFDDERLHAAEDQDATLDQNRMMTTLAEAIAGLPEREKLVLSLYYEQELNMDEVGKVLGLDKSTVCRVHGRALLALRNAMSGWRTEAAGPSSGSGD